jgi:uncharacterized protein (TIGR02680 family)
VYDRASDYRRAVDEALFGLGEQRYEAMVNLLIQLRAPQLSKKPDERLLSRALTEALPPISPALVATVAEAFRGLDEERDALRALEEARKAAEEFLGHYGRYAKIAAKRRAEAPRLSHSKYEHLNRDLGEADGRRRAAAAALEETGRRLEVLAEEDAGLEARREALQSRPEMRTAERIKHLGDEAHRRSEHAGRLERDRDAKAAETERRGRAARTAQERYDNAARTLDRAMAEAAEAAGRARCAPGHAEIIGRWETDPARSRGDSERLAENRASAVAELERLLAELAQARARLAAARREADRLEGERNAAAARIDEADRTTSLRASELNQVYISYLAGLTEIAVDDPDALLATLDAWAQRAEGPNPAAAAVADAARAATQALAQRKASLATRLHDEQTEIERLRAEIEQLEEGAHEAPPVPHTRAGAVRDGRPGAPLWKAVDFSGPLADHQRAGLEAALEAAGILDAWVTPDGRLLAPDDTYLLPGAPVEGISCATVLRPAIDRADPGAAALDEDAVLAVLARIGLGPGGETWVSVDGRWANGVLGGSWRKDSACYIGEGAREAARRKRIELLRAELAEARGREETLAGEIDAVGERQDALRAEQGAVPDDTDLREAHMRLAAEHRHYRDMGDAYETAERIAQARQEETDSAGLRVAEFGSDVGLPTDQEALGEVRTAISDYRVALAGLWPATDALLIGRRSLDEADDDLRRARENLADAAERAATAREHAIAAGQTHQELVATAGAAVDEILRRLEDVNTALTACRAEQKRVESRQRAALEERGKAGATCDALRASITEATRERDAAVSEFRAFAATGLLAVALPELEIPDPGREWAASPAVQLARAVNAELDAVDETDGPWDRVQKRITEEHKRLSDAMSRHGHSVGLTLRDGIMVVDVVFQSRSHDVPALTAALAEETGHRARLLSAREREILENHLLNEVSGTLHELIVAAEREVAAMNAELSSRPTSTGMRLRLLWRRARDAPEGLDRVRAKLRQSVDAWSVEDRTTVGAFLQEEIARAHAGNPAAGWTEALTRALDYRAWHEFAIQRLQDGQWRPATGPASGGERVLAASMPLFAAASAHYKSATNPHAPRLVALDEAFAGVDDDSRAKCLGLLATFDMDVVMTSEREWGCYPQVPGLGICQLSRRDGIDAVLVTPWRWDGRERVRAPRPEPSAATAPAPAHDPEQDGLFG